MAGNTYPLRQCQYAFTRATNERGRVVEKVRHGLVYLLLDVPAGDVLLGWAAAAHKPLVGHVTFFETTGRPARDTLSFAAGECVGYHEHFLSGDLPAGAYVCQVTTAGPGSPRGAPPRRFCRFYRIW